MKFKDIEECHEYYFRLNARIFNHKGMLDDDEAKEMRANLSYLRAMDSQRCIEEAELENEIKKREIENEFAHRFPKRGGWFKRENRESKLLDEKARIKAEEYFAHEEAELEIRKQEVRQKNLLSKANEQKIRAKIDRLEAKIKAREKAHVEMRPPKTYKEIGSEEGTAKQPAQQPHEVEQVDIEQSPPPPQAEQTETQPQSVQQEQKPTESMSEKDSILAQFYNNQNTRKKQH